MYKGIFYSTPAYWPRIFLLLLIAMFTCSFLQAQPVYCPPNIDFESGSYGYWKLYTGTCCPIVTNTLGQVIGRHTLTSGTATDPYGGFPVVAPNGGNYSLKLGNDISGAEAEKAVYYVHIPSGLNNYSLVYNFAVVFEDPNHAPADQPRFEVRAVDSATGVPVPCAQYTYVSGSGLPGFTYIPSLKVWWRGWSTASLDLTGYGGHTVMVSFASGDCALQGHFGYGYVDLACSLFQINSVVCSGQTTQTFSAPPGFQTYQWYDSSYATIIGSGQSITLSTPAQTATYHVVLTPYAGYGCADTLSSTVTVAFPSVTNITQSICEQDTLYGYTASGVYIDSFVNSLGCDSVRILHLTVIPMPDTLLTQTICEPNSYLGYHLTGIYIDTLSSIVSGCDSIRTLDLTVHPITYDTINTSICEPGSFMGYSGTGVYTIPTVNANGCDSLITLNLTVMPITDTIIHHVVCQYDSYLGYSVAGTYVDTLVNANGCDSIRTLNLGVHPVTSSTIYQTICQPDSFLGYHLSGTYWDTLVNANGCDSFRALHLIVNPITYSFIYHTMCDGDTYLGYSQPGTYIDQLTNVNGCDSVRTLFLTVNAVLERDTVVTVCEGSRYFAGGGWQTQAGNYTDSLLSAYGCDSLVHTELSFIKILFPDLGIDRSICPGDSVLLYPGHFNYYRWWDNDQAVDRKTVYTAGMYYVTVSNDSICFASDTILISEYPPLNVHILYTVRDLCKSDTINLTGTGAMQYAWYLNGYFNTPKFEGEVYNFTISSPTKITLVGTDSNHCTGRDEVTLHYISCCGNIAVPNAFSPNGDGHNDVFGAVTNATFETFHLRVFDRWGNEVFHATNKNENWDGTYHGAAAESGTYFYLLRAKCYDENQANLIKGDVLLLR